jgi:hypothetical protein
MIVIGSSLTVSPVNFLPMEFSRVAIINNTPTSMDHEAELVIRRQIGEVMDSLWKEILALNDCSEPRQLRTGFNCGCLVGYLDDQMRTLKSQRGRSKEELHGIAARLNSDFEAVGKIIDTFPTSGLQPLEKNILRFLRSETEKMKKDHQEKFGTDLSPEFSRLGEISGDIFRNSSAALLTYSKQYGPQIEVLERMAVRAAGDFGFWSFVNHTLSLPDAPIGEFEQLKKPFPALPGVGVVSL